MAVTNAKNGSHSKTVKCCGNKRKIITLNAAISSDLLEYGYFLGFGWLLSNSSYLYTVRESMD